VKQIVFSLVLITGIMPCWGCNRSPRTIVYTDHSNTLKFENGRVIGKLQGYSVEVQGDGWGVMIGPFAQNGGNKLEIRDGRAIANDKDGGQLKPGDEVLLDKEGRLFVNGQERLKAPPGPSPYSQPSGIGTIKR